MTGTAVLFPGQGSLTPDAGDYARSVWPELVELACELTGDDPFERATESTAYAQPAIFAASLAGWRERRDELSTGDLVAMAGHSLGELSALAAAGAIEPEAGMRLVALRGQLMDRAAHRAASDGAMVALLGGTPERAHELAGEFGLTIANDNAPGQLVLSGDRSLIDALVGVARAEGFKALVLDVAGAFHSPAIAAAEKPFFSALRAVDWQPTSVPVVSGYSAAPFTDPPAELTKALTNPVRWREVMTVLFDLGARDFLDVGPGRILARLVPRNLPAEDAHALAH